MAPPSLAAPLRRRGPLRPAVLVSHGVGEAVALADRMQLIEDRGITVGEAVVLPRPRSRSGVALARAEERLLDRGRYPHGLADCRILPGDDRSLEPRR